MTEIVMSCTYLLPNDTLFCLVFMCVPEGKVHAINRGAIYWAAACRALGHLKNLCQSIGCPKAKSEDSGRY